MTGQRIPTDGERIDEHDRRLDDHDRVLSDISEALTGVSTRLDKWAKYALLIGVSIASGTKGGTSVIDAIVNLPAA